MSIFPPEIYLSIFYFATYTTYVHDPDPLDMNFQLFITKNYQGALKRSLRTKFSLIQVCRAWKELASPFLYENIVIGRGRYLLPIYSILNVSSRENRSLGYWTKRLDIALRDSARPADEELPLIAEIVRFLPNLEIVAFSVSSVQYTRDDYSPSLILDALASTSAQSLKYIHWFRETLVPDAGDLYALLKKTPNLRSFRTPLVADNRSTKPRYGEFFHRSIIAVHAEHSTVDLDSPIPPEMMNFPSLHQFSFSAPLFTVDVRWEKFLKAHGDHLHHIQVLIYSVDSHLQSDLTYIATSCPNLVRLDLTFSRWSHMPFPIALPPTVQHLGIFCARGQEPNYTVFFSRLDKIHFGDKFRCIQFLGKRNVADIFGKHLHQFLSGTERLTSLGIRFMNHNGAYLV